MSHSTHSSVDSSGSRREIMRLAWPIGVSMLSYTLKGLVDTLMVGQLSTDALAAVGVAGILSFTVLAFGLGVMRGQKSLVSQYLGAGNRAASVAFGAHAFYLAAAFGALCLVLSLWARPTFLALGHGTELSPAAVDMGASYFRVRVALAAPYLMALSLAEYRRATGDTRLPMAADLIAHPLNMLFNWLLIFGSLGFPQLGVAGAALGTGLADTVSLGLLLGFGSMRVKDTAMLRLCMRFDPRRLWRVLSVGSANGVQFTLEVGSFTVITYLISTLGTLSSAVHQAAIQIIHVSFMPAVAIGDAGSVFIGRFVGQLRWDAVRRALRSQLQLMWLLMGSMALVYLFFGDRLMALFLHDPDPVAEAQAIRLGAAVMVAAAFWQLGDAMQIAFRFSLRAAGDHRWVMWAGVLVAWLLSVPLAWGAIHVLDGTVVTVWWVWSTEIYFGSFLFYRRWRSGRWRDKRLVRDEDSVPAADTGTAVALTGEPAASALSGPSGE